MTNRYSTHDQEHYDRPRRRTRPRTKDRPTYDDAVDGVVVTVDRGRLTVLVDGRVVLAVKARPLGRKGVVVGDRVRLVGDVTGDEGSLARIVSIAESGQDTGGSPQPMFLARASMAKDSTQIAPGEKDVTVTVSVRFLLN